MTDQEFSLEDVEVIERNLQSLGFTQLPVTRQGQRQWMPPAGLTAEVITLPTVVLHDFSWMIRRALERLARAQNICLADVMSERLCIGKSRHNKV